MKKFDIKIGLAFGIPIMVVFIIFNLFSANVFELFTVLRIVMSGVVTGAVAGILFSFFISIFKSSKLVHDIDIELDPDEEVVFETDANHFVGAEGVGGKLFLTTNRLVFNSHKINIQSGERSIMLEEIAEIKRYKTLGFINNGISVISNSNRVDRFVVEQPDKWLERLN